MQGVCRESGFKMKTSISWAEHSINPIRARHKSTGKVGHYCEKIATGCTRCYSADMQKRFGTPAFGSGQCAPAVRRNGRASQPGAAYSYNRLTDEGRAEIVRLKIDGVSTVSVAEKVGTSAATVCTVWKNHLEKAGVK